MNCRIEQFHSPRRKRRVQRKRAALQGAIMDDSHRASWRNPAHNMAHYVMPEYQRLLAFCAMICVFNDLRPAPNMAQNMAHFFRWNNRLANVEHTRA